MMKKLRRRFYLWRKERRDGATEDFSPHGVPVHVPATADISLRYLLTRGRDYEREEAAMVRDFLAPGMNVIELGGCMGIISALIRDRIGPEAKHVVVEALAARIEAGGLHLCHRDGQVMCFTRVAPA